MQELTIGELLERLRKKTGAAKGQIARGLCSLTALSRYEQGEREPGKFLAEALLSRLGAETQQMDFITDANEFELSMMRREIQKALENHKGEVVEKILRDYKALIKKDKNLHHAYIDFVKGQNQIIVRNWEKGEILLKRALCYTDLEEYEQVLEQGFLSGQELYTLYCLGEVYMGERRKEEGWKLFNLLKQYLDKRETSYTVKGLLYPKLLLWLAKRALEEGNWGSACKAAEEARKLLLKYYAMDGLEEALEILNQSEEKLGILDYAVKLEREKQIFALKLSEVDISEDIEAINREVEEWPNIARDL